MAGELCVQRHSHGVICRAEIAAQSNYVYGASRRLSASGGLRTVDAGRDGADDQAGDQTA
ncbi:hypothetical protein FTO74_18270 [Granulicella sp. WH15]|uniref:hypothetical protein n=1 Tax=Granulicella sp. WH15 TaxID=2602070 RepID=UPI0013677FC1|nr:hypothetical protein [Granulicella sp. WH15]QHN05077.1 hypothetical protein FTO74_18270 [Granulicella sp. WH15]